MAGSPRAEKYKPLDPLPNTGTIADTGPRFPQLNPRPVVGEEDLPVAPATNGEVYRAARVVARNDRSDFDEITIRDGYAPILEQLGLDIDQNPIAFSDVSVKGERMLRSSAFLRRQGKSWSASMVDRSTQEQFIANEIRARRAKDPNFLAGLPDTVAGLRRHFIETEKANRRRAQRVTERADGWGGFFSNLGGGVVELMHDPLNIISLPIGGGGKTVAQTVGREILVNGALELIQQPLVAQNRETIGETLTLGEAAFNVGAAGVTGGLLEGGLKAGGKGVAKLNDALGNPAGVAVGKVNEALLAVSARAMQPGQAFGEISNRELAGFVRTHAGDRMTPDELAAANLLEREQDIGDTNPFEDGPAGEAKHEEGISGAINDLIANRRPQEPSPAAGERPPAEASTAAERPQAPRPQRPIGPASLPADVLSGLKARGIPDHVARGAAAGIVAESRASHSIVNPASGAYGLGQWLGPRKRELFKRYGPSPTREQQLDFLAWELKGGDHGGAAVLAAKDEVAALNAYIRDFMRPGQGKETTGDLERGMAALGRSGGELPGEAPAGGGEAFEFADDSAEIARLRASAAQLDDSIIGSTFIPGAGMVPLYGRRVPASEALVDAARFQFKSGGDAEGVIDTLQGVKAWDPLSAGRLTFWQDNEGRYFVADGHQRSGLARRLEAAGHEPIDLHGVVLREADGVTAEQARATAALINIRNGSGSRIDAAKVLRDLGFDTDLNLPPSSSFVRDARGLARLADDAFGAVVNERVPAEIAAVVGRLLPDKPELHGGMVDILARYDPARIGEAESIVRDALSSGVHTEEQIDLFGTTTVSRPLFLERAKIKERALGELRKMRVVHSTAAKNSGELEAKGSKIAKAASEKEAKANAEAAEFVDRLYTRAGPVSDALNAAAARLAGGAKLADATDGFVAAVKALDLEALARGAEGDGRPLDPVDGSGRGGDAGGEGESLPDEQPTLGDLLGATERFSDPDGAAVKTQADSLVHDLKADFIEFAGDTSHLPNIDVSLEPPAVPTAPAGQATEIFGEWLGDWGHKPLTGKAAKAADAHEAVLDAMAKAADTRALKAKREISVDMADEEDLDLEAIEAIAREVLAGADPDKAVEKAIKDGRLVVTDHGDAPPAADPKPHPPSAVVPPPESPKRSADYAGDFISQEEAKAKLEAWKAEAQRIGRESPPPPGTVILSLFDSSGQFSKPYREMGYEVIQIDKNLGVDVIEDISMIQHAIEEVKARGGRFAGVLAQPPCTTFAGSGARWWDERHNRNWFNAVRKMWGDRAAKMFESPVEYNQFLVLTTEEFISRAKPDFFVMENPRGRIAKLNGLPKANLEIEPHHFGDAYTKNTFLYGKFNNELETANVSPRKEDGGEGSRAHNLRGRDEKDEGLRSLTPEGFAYAFALANRPGTEGRAVEAPSEGVLHGDAPAPPATRRDKIRAATEALKDTAPGELRAIEPFPDEEPGYHRFRYVARDGTAVGGNYTLDGGPPPFVEGFNVGDTNNPVKLRPAEVRAMFDELRRLHPEAERIHAFRMTGARAAAGSGPREIWIDLKGKSADGVAPEDVDVHAGEPIEAEGDAPALDLGEQVDPAIAERQRQEIQLRANSPLRPGDVDAQGEIGLPMFDAADQVTFRLDEEGGEISAADLLAELEADDKAIQALRNCL